MIYGIALLLICGIYYAFKTAPEGYQKDGRFYYGKEGKK